jgi:hypothetical protein
MRRVRIVGLAVVMAVALLAPQSVGAAAPVRFPAIPPTGTFPAGLFCAFPIYTQPAGSHVQTLTIFTDAAGNPTRFLFTGALSILLRDADTGKTIVVNASGQGVSIPQPDGSSLNYGSGPGLIGVAAGDPAGRQLTQVFGHETFTASAPDANGISHISNLVIVGRSIDLCAVLTGG